MTGQVPSGTLAVELIRQWAEQRGLVFHHDELLGSGAVFSPCDGYRYLLWRSGASAPFMGFLMLNPSTADHAVDDPTIKRCRTWAGQGSCGLLVMNLFALRSTDPKALYSHDDAVGEHNDTAIDLGLSLCAKVVAAWGTNGELDGRGLKVKQRCRAAEAELHALKLTAGGHPGHPLYIAGTAQPVSWDYDW